ncbi:hypothetical protein ACFQBQ_10535 [Granulicella cerasi]|uniref:Uncharacterized protein n=1 Tax=Granulicella cerasi TaxID=741063 RepID=A0ABW1ZA07_9BACT|nr:hypothetical protein [Granulicella cerasi]
MLFKIAYRVVGVSLLFPLPPFSVKAGAQDLKSPASAPASLSAVAAEWKSETAQHAFGLPEVKPKAKGTLALMSDSLTFTTKASRYSIPRSAITAVSAGNDRVELWGTGGRLMRMVIPDGGGMAAAAMMHHRVDMLTVDFRDPRGGYHAAVFYLPASSAELALKRFAQGAPYVAAPATDSCGKKPINPDSVFVAFPDWNRVDVPAAYRGLVYEHIIDRLEARNSRSVYRYGVLAGGTYCPRYTVEVAIEGYKKGNQVMRAAMGPIGMFTSATQMKFSVSFIDDATGVKTTDAIKATVRTESESTEVADAVAKQLAKHYARMLKRDGGKDALGGSDQPSNQMVAAQMTEPRS